MSITDYKIIRRPLTEDNQSPTHAFRVIELEVQTFLADNWQPVGEARQVGDFVCQTMVKTSEKE